MERRSLHLRASRDSRSPPRLRCGTIIEVNFEYCLAPSNFAGVPAPLKLLNCRSDRQIGLRIGVAMKSDEKLLEGGVIRYRVCDVLITWP